MYLSFSRLLSRLRATATAICRSRERDVLWTSDSLTIESTADKTKDRSSCNGRSESNAAYPRISFLFLTNGGDRPSSPLENGQHYTLFFFSFFFFFHAGTRIPLPSSLPSPPSPFVTQKTDTGRWNRISFFYFLLRARMDMIKENQSWTLGTCVQSESRVNLCLKLCGLFDRVWWFFFFLFLRSKVVYREWMPEEIDSIERLWKKFVKFFLWKTSVIYTCFLFIHVFPFCRIIV